jgi:hypothetical protein
MSRVPACGAMWGFRYTPSHISANFIRSVRIRPHTEGLAGRARRETPSWRRSQSRDPLLTVRAREYYSSSFVLGQAFGCSCNLRGDSCLWAGTSSVSGGPRICERTLGDREAGL